MDSLLFSFFLFLLIGTNRTSLLLLKMNNWEEKWGRRWRLDGSSESIQANDLAINLRKMQKHISRCQDIQTFLLLFFSVAYATFFFFLMNFILHQSIQFSYSTLDVLTVYLVTWNINKQKTLFIVARKNLFRFCTLFANSYHHQNTIHHLYVCVFHEFYEIYYSFIRFILNINSTFLLINWIINTLPSLYI